MARRDDAPRDLLFGLLALQNAMITRDQLLAAFGAWTASGRPLADLLAEQGALRPEHRRILEALAAAHQKLHGGDPEKSLAAIELNRSTRESLARLGNPEIETTLGHVGSAQGSTENGDVERTATYAVGTATSDGQRFRVLRPHARGGLGFVSVALDAELNREVALKQILDHHADDPTSRQRFLIEAEVTGGLEHPGIVPVYGLGSYAGGRPYYAMRFIRGDSLKEAVDRFHADESLKRDRSRRSLELRKLLRRFVDVCNAIDYAHSRGVLHRDIKPGNVIVGKHGETLVVDWGLAKALGRVEPGAVSGERLLVPSSASGSGETLPGSALGTPSYMSPEQAEGDLERLGPRSDVYSLGATLYYLLTGRPPTEGDVGEVLRAAQKGEFPPPRRHDPTLDKALEAICLKAMAHRPADRYDAPRSLSEDLERWMADEAVAAYPEPWTRALTRWLARHRTGVTAAGSGLLMALVGTAAVLAVQAAANASLSASLTREKAARKELAGANIELQESNTRERESRERAQRRFELARQAIEQYYTGASEDVLLKQPELVALRKNLLGTALAFYKRLQAELEGPDDPATRTELASAFTRVGQITADVGIAAEALEAYQRARLIHEELQRADPSAAGPRRALAGDLQRSGRLLTTISGREDEALPLLERSLALRAGSAGETANTGDRLEMARTYLDIALNRRRVGRAEEAMRAAETSRDLAEKLVADHPRDDAARHTLGGAWTSLALQQIFLGRHDAARRSLQQSISLQEQLTARHPGEPGSRSDLAFALGEAGVQFGNMRREDESLPYLRRALELYRALTDEFPTVTSYRYHVARIEMITGVALQRLNRNEEALSALERGEPMLERLAADHPGVTMYAEDHAYALLNIAVALRTLRRPDEARLPLDRARAIYERQPPEPSTLLNLACVNSILSALAGGDDGRAYADRAMAALRRSVKAGFLDVQKLRSDPDLDALRSRSDFQMLLLDAAFPRDPFAHGD
jgi:serine/threonine-protein kinase